ncbi:MAG TPA: MarR family transcriptional regulator [Candidatus Cybelea sp.]|nr:MarR family transcriptional regulator [Candidatus Cybelea sp.]
MSANASAVRRSVNADAKLELKLWLRLLACTTIVERDLRSRLRQRFGSTLPRFDLLSQLDRAPEGLSMGELSSRLMVSNGNVTGLTERLVREGLVKRTASPADRRTSRVTLTAAGKRAFDAMTPDHEAWIDELLSGLSRDEQALLHRLLGKLKSTMPAGQNGTVRL